MRRSCCVQPGTMSSKVVEFGASYVNVGEQDAPISGAVQSLRRQFQDLVVVLRHGSHQLSDWLAAELKADATARAFFATYIRDASRLPVGALLRASARQKAGVTKMKKTSAFLTALAATMGAATLQVQIQAQERPMPRIVQKDGRYALFVDDAPFLILGTEDLTIGQWTTSPDVWPNIEHLNANTVEVSIYWEQLEPQPSQYDFTMVDRLVREARQHQVRLVLLWFGMYYNGHQHYTPDWVKLDPVRYPHALNRDGEAVDSLSPLAPTTLEVDKAAFSALMRHLKETDPQRTVIMIQVENETGNWESVRDFSPAAQKLFEAPVPPEILKAMPVLSTSGSPNWQQAYGSNADEYFNAWAVASYVGQVAAAGKAVYPLPMDANCALRDPLRPGPPGIEGPASGRYESGGPTDNVIPIWRAAAPAIDIEAPDIYRGDPASYLKDLELYHRDDNPLFVAETGGAVNARFFFSALNLQTLGYSPFGAADIPQADAEPWALNYRLVGPIQREIARLNFEGKLKAAAEPPHIDFFQGGDVPNLTQTMSFDGWDAVVSYGVSRGGNAGWNSTPKGGALVAQVGKNEFLVTGYFSHVDFWPAGTDQQRKTQLIEHETKLVPASLIDGKWLHRQYVHVEQGTEDNGTYKFLRILSGSDLNSGINFDEKPMVLRVELNTY